MEKLYRLTPAKGMSILMRTKTMMLKALFRKLTFSIRLNKSC